MFFEYVEYFQILNLMVTKHKTIWENNFGLIALLLALSPAGPETGPSQNFPGPTCHLPLVWYRLRAAAYVSGIP